jgi:cell division protein FtsI (penicillin-binding protein 3)
MEIKKDILWRVFLMYFLLLGFSGVIVWKIVRLQVVEGENWRKASENFTYHYKDIEAVRGNIFDVNGKLIATSLPYYDLAVDVNADPISDDFFYKKVDSLSAGLSALFGDRSTKDYRSILISARKSGNRYLVLRKNISYSQLQEVKKLPVFNKGRYKGGLIYTQKNLRELPFKDLAARTIGYFSDNAKPVGLEGAFNQQLQGIGGKRLMKKIAGGVDMPVNDNNEVDPQDGADLITTLDINLQDVVETELKKQLIKHRAQNGCVVLMETQTGEVRAIANLTRKDSSTYVESYNYAIGSATEPGSTFKLASLMACLEDKFITLEDEYNVEGGETKFYDTPMKDSHRPQKNKMTVKEIFWESSNVGVSKIVWKYYSRNPKSFVERINRMNLGRPLGIVIPGEGKPRIKGVKDKDWSGVSLPFMSIGYESLLTPLQILAFYNAVANDGKMMKPLFVKEVRRRGEVVKKFEPEQIGAPIASPEVIAQARVLLEGVVESGTAKSLQNNIFKIAGKTGTAQIAMGGKGYGQEGRKKYQASFVGYFPADKPKYSCIVVVSAPSNDAYYGALVAGPIFKQVADKIYSGSLDIHEKVNSFRTHEGEFPEIRNGYTQNLKELLTELGLPFELSGNPDGWTEVGKSEGKIILQEPNATDLLKKGIMPDLRKWALADALVFLENSGYVVKIKGSGKIIRQVPAPGEAVRRKETINLILAQ